MGCVLVELDSGLVVPGVIQFGGRTSKSMTFTTRIPGYQDTRFQYTIPRNIRIPGYKVPGHHPAEYQDIRIPGYQDNKITG